MPDSPESGAELDGHKLAAARLMATNHYPYLASAIFASPVLPAPGLNGVVIDRWWRVHADPQVIAHASVAEIAGELLHLTSHVLRDHAARADEIGLREPAELHHWVDAADAEITDDFPTDTARVADRVAPGDLDLGPGRLAEEYYRRGSVREGATNDCGSGAHGAIPEWEPPPPPPRPSDPDKSKPSEASSGIAKTEQELLRQKVASDIAQADHEAVSPNLREWARSQLEKPVDWRRELAALLRQAISATAGAVDYSYRRPSRRASASHGVIMPSLQQPTVEVAVVCDTSASVSDHMLGQAIVEVDTLLRSHAVRSVRVLSCDDQVQTVEQASRGRELTLLGGGGTDMAIGIDAAMDQRPQPDLLVVLTDGYTPWPSDPPRARTIVGLLGADDSSDMIAGTTYSSPIEPPEWARTVHIGGPAR